MVHTLKDIAGDDDELPEGAMGMPVDGEKMGSDFHGLYHEKQIGALCAVHAMNNLVQNREYDEVALAQVAHELDAAEREALGGSSLAGEEGSGNVRADGFFSVQVIVSALQADGLQCVPAHAVTTREAAQETGFIFNRREHWFALRKIGGFWFDLNSMFAAPKHLSEAHLEMFFAQQRNDGYTIYVVRGRFPRAKLDNDRARLQAAIEACKFQAGGPAPSGQKTAPGFAAFAGQGQTLSAPPPLDPELAAAAAADPELAAAIAMSLSENDRNKPSTTAQDDAAEIRRKRLARFG
ncbi:Josephin-domain-containing protein [Pelagophyceae sp. CCMP2097]|nr:Josephin-domain-containing protein [Pelagophyceae sp. CCMP2097]|mmetsp:Transcript_22354/g.75620  ORF Transcript_22354/g.75620 Transcript_22354/m.75620 type:complete len:294 (-) Transcript_22354:64-945(-)